MVHISPSTITPRRAFSIVELFVSVAVLGVLMFLVGHLFNGATLATTSANKHMDADTQTRLMFDRLAIDFAQMLRRPDVDYFLKDDINRQAGSGVGENDQIAFFSQVTGNVPNNTPTISRSPVSLIGYRIEPDPYKLQRFGNGLLWQSAPPDGILFSPVSRSSGTTTISSHWPAATNLDPDPNYDTLGADVFRLEYYYVLKSPTMPNGTPRLDGQGNPMPSKLSAIPWDSRIPAHTSVEGLRDVAAIVVTIAVIDAKSRVTADETDLATMSQALPDFDAAMLPGDLENSWRTAADGQRLRTVPPSAIRFYSRCFYLQ